MVLDIVQKYLPEAEVWAYGSRVMGGCYELMLRTVVAKGIKCRC